MNLKFILGKAQNDKQGALLADLKHKLTQNPQDQFVWIVPNHLKFEGEVHILKSLTEQSQIFATNQVQVFSFSRLAWYFLRNDPVYQTPQLTATTQAMILAKIVQQLAAQLHLYKGEASRPGFIVTLQEQINELINGNISSERLQQLASQAQDVGDLTIKLSDLQLIYQAYQEQIQDTYSNNQQLNSLLKNFLETDEKQNHFHYFVSDFSQFNSQEMAILQAMISHAASVEISLTLDHAYSIDQESIFFQRPRKTFLDLFQWARQQKIPVTTQTVSKLRVSQDLAALEDFWIAQNTNLSATTAQKLEDASSIQIWTDTSPQKEVAAVTTYIRQLVATQGYRYRDFLVLARNLDEYRQFLEPYFFNQGISYFVDLQHSMKDHAFKDLIDSIFALFQNNLQYVDVIRFLRTELIVPASMSVTDYRQAVDLTDNYILAHGIRAHDWLDEAEFISDSHNSQLQAQIEQINQIKALIKSTYQKIATIIQTPATCRQAAEQLYTLLTDLKVFINLKDWEQQAIAAGDITLSQQPQQIVKMFAQLLDEYVTIFGNEDFNAQEFLIVIDNGFDQAKYSTIPSVIDSVHISELGMVQSNNQLITIIMGANDADMPLVNTNHSLLSDDDLALLQPLLQTDESLPETEQQLNNNEPYLHDIGFLTGKERLIFTYSSTKEQGEVRLSPYVELIKKHFQLTEQPLDCKQSATPQSVLRTIGSPTITLNHLLEIYRHAQDQQQQVAPWWQNIHDILFTHAANKDYLNLLWSSLHYQNIPQPLTVDLSQKLYGDHLAVSISQLETFYQNPYEYFLRYGLNLQSRAEFKITPANQGTFFHEVMDQTIKELQSQQKTLNQLSAQELTNLSNQVIQKILAQKQYRIFSRDEKFARQRMIQTVQNSLEALRKQSRSAQFYPYKTEVAFGQVGALHNIEPLRYELNAQQDVVVRGRIDRIDRLVSAPQDYFVVDYKSSLHDFNFSQFYAGINLQMMTYLASLINDPSLFDGPAFALGGFYLHLQNPIVNFEDLKGQWDNYQDYLFKKYKYKG
ncbi:PD-(D/E)XK nuclease family protein, partial [Bombilactobacillus bombi]|uniref:PD-(D/E)XK nuclease family protein n=1 Tax=Bombilactobacillus bombi TaxID=1303590 RepID=UPI0015E5ABCE